MGLLDVVGGMLGGQQGQGQGGGLGDLAAMLGQGGAQGGGQGGQAALLQMVLSMLAKNSDVERLGEASAVREINGFTMRPSELGARFTPRASA